MPRPISSSLPVCSSCNTGVTNYSFCCDKHKNICEGLTFVITGDVHHFKNRNELKAYIEARGGKVAGSVSGSTSFLINNDVTSTSGKNKKAKELGIPILSEDDFLSRFSADDQAEEARPTPSATQLSLDF